MKKNVNSLKRKLNNINNYSVSMCVYHNDNPVHFKQSFQSIINQTILPDEIVLVIDGPITNELEEAVTLFQTLYKKLKIIRFSENKGHGEARRKGFEACSNELIAIMDADDICVKDRFEKQLNAFNCYDADVVGGQINEFVDSPENIVGKRLVPLSDKEIKQYSKKRCPMNQVTVMMKKSSYNDAGGYLDMYQEEDYYLWVRMILKNKKFANLSDVLVNVRVGSGMYSRRGGLKYFKSEKKLQKFLLSNKLIGFGRYTLNIIERFIVQVMMTNKMRTKFFKCIRSN